MIIINTGTTGYVSSRLSIPLEDTWVTSEHLDTVGITGRTASDIHHLVEECYVDNFGTQKPPSANKKMRIGVLRLWGGHGFSAGKEIETFWEDINNSDVADVREIEQSMFMDINEFRVHYTTLLCNAMYDNEAVAGDFPFRCTYQAPAQQVALFFMKRWVHYMKNFMEQNQLDIIVTPSSSREFTDTTEETTTGSFSDPFVLSGNPVVTIPVNTMLKSGLPLAVQLVGRHDSDIQLLSNAQQLSNIFDSLRQKDSFYDSLPIDVITKAVGSS